MSAMLVGGAGAVALSPTNPLDVRAAFELESISLRRVAESERSTLAAFIGGGRNRVILIALLLVLLGGGGALLIKRQQRSG